jgi:putative aldouronate transport system permease protein
MKSGAAGSSQYFRRGRWAFSKDQWPYLLLVAPCVLFLFAFIYLPMGGLVLAFKNFNVTQGIWGSPWVGLQNFRFFIQSEYAWRATVNTVYLNILFIGSTHLFAIFCAIALYEIRSRRFRKLVQSITYFPSFLSWVIVGVLATPIFSNIGIANKLLADLGLGPVNWYMQVDAWPFILTFITVWKNAGVDIVIYLAALSAMSPEYYEAAMIDGAGFWRRTRSITLPHLLPTVVILLLMAVGGIFKGDSQMMIALIDRNAQLYPRTDVLDYFVYRSLMKSGDVGMPAAVGLYQSVVGFVCVMIANWGANRYQKEAALF